MEHANLEDLPSKDGSWTIHDNNVHALLIEIDRSLNHISPPIMQEFFNLKVTPYSLRNNNLPRLPKTSISPYSVRMRENTHQKLLRIWTFFTQCYTLFEITFKSEMTS